MIRCDIAIVKNKKALRFSDTERRVLSVWKKASPANDKSILKEIKSIADQPESEIKIFDPMKIRVGLSKNMTTFATQ